MRPKLIPFLLVASVLSCRDPRVEANIAQAMIDAGNNIVSLQQDLGDLHTELDSLRQVVAQQDTLLRRLASMAGVPVPPR